MYLFLLSVPNSDFIINVKFYKNKSKLSLMS